MVSSDEEQRGGNGQPSHAIRRAVAQDTEYLPYVEDPSMEPAFGGVKSSRKRSQTVCCVRFRVQDGRLERITSSVYLRSMSLEFSSAHAARCFRFLRQLRADGRINMYGAVPYLMKTFNLDRDAAFAIVCQWLDQQDQVEPIPPSRPRRIRSKSS